MHCFSVMKVLFDLLGVSLIIAPYFFFRQANLSTVFPQTKRVVILLDVASDLATENILKTMVEAAQYVVTSLSQHDRVCTAHNHVVTHVLELCTLSPHFGFS